MKLKVFGLVVATILIYLACVSYNAYVMPGPVSDLAISQMEMDDDAALAIRSTSQALAWQFPVGLVVWVLAATVIFRTEIKNGFSYLKDQLKEV